MPTSTRAVGTPVFMKRCGKTDRAQRADRVVRPYRTLCVFAEGICNFVIAHCRVDVGIDPYGHFTLLPLIVRICWCTVRLTLGITRGMWYAIR